MNCELCHKIGTSSSYLVHEFKNSFWILGDHQFFKGYSQIISKIHLRDLLDLPPEVNQELFGEVMQAYRATQTSLNPWKINLSCYGNAVPHIHWHIFPRYESEVDVKKVPWFYMDEFQKVPTSGTDYQSIIKQLKSAL
jgi:diadenosine tetraphosphate (Ap4A) HIT family hydrolase